MSSKSKKGKSPVKSKSDNKGPKVMVDAQVVHDPSINCLICYKAFKDSADLQGHLVNLAHDKRNPRYFRCRVCGQTVLIEQCEKHKCAFIKANFIRQLMTIKNLKYGPPNRCLLCNCAVAPSRIHLVLHLICFHSSHSDGKNCGMCGNSFDDHEGIGDDCKGPSNQPNSKSGGKGKSKSPDNSKKSPNNSKKTPKSKGSNKSGSDKKGAGAEQDRDYQMFDNVIAHIEAKHQKYLLLEIKKMNWHASDTRSPFSCPICNTVCFNNAEFHAHILCCHTHKGDIGNKMLACSECDVHFGEMRHLAHHVKANHQDKYMELAGRFIKDQLMQESADPSDACHMCWQFFKSPTELQMHLVSRHVGMNRLRCGLCLMSYGYAQTLDLAAKSFENHVKNHAIEYLESAAFLNLEYGDYKQPLHPVGLSKEEYCIAKYGEEAKQSNEKSDSKSKGKKKDSSDKSDKKKPQKKK